MTVAARARALDSGAYLIESYDESTDRVLNTAVTKTLPSNVPLIPRPDPDRVKNLSARRALLRLLTRRPNTIVTHSEVEDEAGHPVSRAALSQAAASLRKDIALRSKAGHGGGYVLLVPVYGPAAAPDCEACWECRHFTVLEHCTELDREVDKWDWCWAWDGADA